MSCSLDELRDTAGLVKISTGNRMNASELQKAERSVSKQGHLQPRCHTKARSPSRQL